MLGYLTPTDVFKPHFKLHHSSIRNVYIRFEICALRPCSDNRIPPTSVIEVPHWAPLLPIKLGSQAQAEGLRWNPALQVQPCTCILVTSMMVWFDQGSLLLAVLLKSEINPSLFPLRWNSSAENSQVQSKGEKNLAPAITVHWFFVQEANIFTNTHQRK